LPTVVSDDHARVRARRFPVDTARYPKSTSTVPYWEVNRIDVAKKSVTSRAQDMPPATVNSDNNRIGGVVDAYTRDPLFDVSRPS